MPHFSILSAGWAVAAAAIVALATNDPPSADAERALLGRTPAREAGSSNLRMARLEGQVSPTRALLGELTHSEAQAGSEQAIQVLPRKANGLSALAGRP